MQFIMDALLVALMICLVILLAVFWLLEAWDMVSLWIIILFLVMFRGTVPSYWCLVSRVSYLTCVRFSVSQVIPSLLIYVLRTYYSRLWFMYMSSNWVFRYLFCLLNWCSGIWLCFGRINWPSGLLRLGCRFKWQCVRIEAFIRCAC